MITRYSRPQPVPSLSRDGKTITDRSSGRSINMNPTAENLFEHLDGQRSLEQIAVDLCTSARVGEQRCLSDIIGFASLLYDKGFVNVSYSRRQFARSALLALFTLDLSLFGALVGGRRRVDVVGGSFASILVQISFHVLLRFWWLPVCTALTFLVLGWTFDWSLLTMLSIPAATTVGLLLGLSLHESAHLYTLRRRLDNPHLGYLRFSSIIGISVLRPVAQDNSVEIEVAASGPIYPVVCGVLLQTASVALESLALSVCGLLLVVHALSLLPISSDGKRMLSFAKNRPKEEVERNG